MKGLGLFASAVVVWLAGYIHGYGVGEREGLDSAVEDEKAQLGFVHPSLRARGQH